MNKPMPLYRTKIAFWNFQKGAIVPMHGILAQKLMAKGMIERISPSSESVTVPSAPASMARDSLSTPTALGQAVRGRFRK